MQLILQVIAALGLSNRPSILEIQVSGYSLSIDCEFDSGLCHVAIAFRKPFTPTFHITFSC